MEISPQKRTPKLWVPPRLYVPKRRAQQNWGVLPYPTARPWLETCQANRVAGAFSLTQTDHTVTTVGATTYTFTSRAIGTAANDRYVIVGAGTRGGTNVTIDAVTVGGISASSVVAAPSATQIPGAFWIAAVPTGTTATITVTVSAATANCGIVVWRMVGAASSAATSTASTNTIDTGADSLEGTIVIPTNGTGIGYVVGEGTAAGRTWVWINLTENTDETIEGTVTHSSALSSTVGSALRTADASGNLARATLVLAAWGP